MSSHDPKSVVRRYYEEIANQRRFDRADEIIAADFKLFPDSEPPYGPQGVKEFLTWLLVTTFPDMYVTIEDLVAEGELVAAGVTLHATQTLPIDWLDAVVDTIPATGKRFAMQEFVFWRVVDGKIVERRIVVGALGMVMQLGVQLHVGALPEA